MTIFEKLTQYKFSVAITGVALAGLAIAAIANTRSIHDESPKTGRDVQVRRALERHWSDIENQDVTHEIYHEDVMVEFPQSGERFSGLADLRAMREAYPAKVSATIRQSRGAGDFWVTELVLTYDGKKQVNAVSIMEFQSGKVVRETLYFGDPWDPPAWRAQWTTRKK
jgi:hypothetical protein